MRFETVKQGVSTLSARNRIPPRRAAERSSAPDFTAGNCIHARRRIAAMLAAGLPVSTVTGLFGLQETEFQFAADDELAGGQEST
ncbi:MAG TPA: hypothetical protein VGL34_28530 [Steroidobacteraceae bacterium]|jgi:hypothetical protein